MMRIKMLLLLTVYVLLFNGCTSKVEKTITGFWTIDRNDLSYEGVNIFFNLLSNIITFKSDHTCGLPVSLTNEYQDEGTWELLDTNSPPYLLKIESKNKMFAGIHKVRFERDEKNKLLKMIITSDKLYVKCSKGLFDYDSNQDLIDALTIKSL